MTRDELLEKVNNLPQVPGVYIYRDKSGEVIYVGKARNLRSRVGSYFKLKLDETSKTFALVQKITELSYIEVASEFDALILEAELIKKFWPKYNISLKDDKSYIYIVIRKEKFTIGSRTINLAKVATARKTTILPNDIVFGPYPDGTTVKYMVRTLRKLFTYRDCSATKFAKYSKLDNPCLYGHIGLCLAPCVHNTEMDLKEYNHRITQIKNLLEGKGSQVVKNLETQMKTYSKSNEYEKAAIYRDLLGKFDYVRQSYRSPGEYIGNPYLMDDLKQKALTSLAEAIPFLNSPPERIECYDIANISGKEAVASMVVATNGKIDKSEYKKFKIKFKNTPDDFEMMREVLYRRLKREGKADTDVKNWPSPSLIVVDGGKGQVSAATDVLSELKLNIPLIGLAKKEEIIVYKDFDDFVELKLDRSNEGIKLLMALRDEAHRFAQSYHHLLRLQSINI